MAAGGPYDRTCNVLQDQRKGGYGIPPWITGHNIGPEKASDSDLCRYKQNRVGTNNNQLKRHCGGW